MRCRTSYLYCESQVSSFHLLKLESQFLPTKTGIGQFFLKVPTVIYIHRAFFMVISNIKSEIKLDKKYFYFIFGSQSWLLYMLKFKPKTAPKKILSKIKLKTFKNFNLNIFYPNIYIHKCLTLKKLR